MKLAHLGVFGYSVLLMIGCSKQEVDKANANGQMDISLSKNDRNKNAKNLVASTYAGTGDAGVVDGPVGLARFNRPGEMINSRSGDIYVTDVRSDGRSCIRKITKDGIVSTLNTPSLRLAISITIDRDRLIQEALGATMEREVVRPNFLYVLDTTQHAIFKLNTETGEESAIRMERQADVPTIFMPMLPGLLPEIDPDENERLEQEIRDLLAIFYDSQNVPYLGKIAPDGKMTRICSIPDGSVNGGPRPHYAMASDQGDLYMAVATTQKMSLYRLMRQPAKSMVKERKVVAIPGYREENFRLLLLKSVPLNNPSNDAFHMTAANGHFYFDDNGLMSPAPDLTELVPENWWWLRYSPGFQNGPMGTAKFDHPQGICLDQNGDILVADEGNHVIRKISQKLSVF